MHYGILYFLNCTACVYIKQYAIAEEIVALHATNKRNLDVYLFLKLSILIKAEKKYRARI